MAKLHHLVLKSAVAKYASFHTAGANAEEVKAEIAKDEKGFDQEGIDEIYAAITADDTSNEPANGSKPNKYSEGKKHIVASPFRCINNFDKQYSVGEDVSHFDKARLEKLVNNKMVELK